MRVCAHASGVRVCMCTSVHVSSKVIKDKKKNELVIIFIILIQVPVKYLW